MIAILYWTPQAPRHRNQRDKNLYVFYQALTWPCQAHSDNSLVYSPSQHHNYNRILRIITNYNICFITVQFHLLLYLSPIAIFAILCMKITIQIELYWHTLIQIREKKQNGRFEQFIQFIKLFLDYNINFSYLQ